MTRSLPLRAAVLAALALAALAILLVLAIGWQANRALSERTLSELSDDLVEITRDLTDRATIEARVRQRIESEATSPRHASRNRNPLHLWHLSGRDGTRIASSFNAAETMRPPFVAVTSSPTVFSYMWHGETRLAVAIGTSTSTTPPLTLIVARDIEDERALAFRVQLIALAGLGTLGIAALVIGALVRRALLTRLAAINSTAQSIMAGDLIQRIPRDNSNDEIDALAGRLNDMLSRIDGLMQALKEVSDNIAHDLKTPINRLRNTAEDALRAPPSAQGDALGAIIEQADGIIQTFNALLQIARLEHGTADLPFDDVDLSQLVTDVVELYEPVAEMKNLVIRQAASAPTPHRANRQLLGQALANMIDNALKYSSDPTFDHELAIDVQLVSDSSHHHLIVADQGPGIPVADRDKALKRFGRLDASRSRPGTGLGLSLVTAIARLHGGWVTLDDNTPKGLRVTVSLPRHLAR